MTIDDRSEVGNRLARLEEKYAAMGQDMTSYLDGLLHADFLTYWDYIHIDTLLSLQNTRTPIPDERIFLMYHQITELYFRLILDAIEQITLSEVCPLALFKRQLERVNRYFDVLIYSYDIMVDGMDKDEFLKFRMSLLPASGFQSAQFRKIEIWSADLSRLIRADERERLKDETDLSKLYPSLYWKSGATELATGKKTLTLRQFELKYSKELIDLAGRAKENNIWRRYLQLRPDEQNDADLIAQMKTHDLNVNVRWRLSHFRSAVKHLESRPHAIAATGGTNWQEYLPPKNQRIIFYPALWSEAELEEWGKKPKMLGKFFSVL